MKKRWLLTISIIPLSALTCICFTSCANLYDPSHPLFNYEMISSKQKSNLNGKQGIAMDDNFYYISDNDKLIKYDKDWKLIKEIDDVKNYFTNVDNSHHIGDIEVYDGVIYTVGENFEHSVGGAIEVGLFDINLQWMKTLNIYPDEHGLKEVSGITIDISKSLIWISSWCDGDSGQYLYAYSYPNFKFIKKIKTNPWVQKIQGIKYYKGFIFASCDDSEKWSGNKETKDHLYRINPKNGHAILEHTLNEFDDNNETEGLTIDSHTGEFLIMQNMSNGLLTYFKTSKYKS